MLCIQSYDTFQRATQNVKPKGVDTKQDATFKEKFGPHWRPNIDKINNRHNYHNKQFSQCGVWKNIILPQIYAELVRYISLGKVLVETIYNDWN